MVSPSTLKLSLNLSSGHDTVNIHVCMGTQHPRAELANSARDDLGSVTLRNWLYVGGVCNTAAELQSYYIPPPLFTHLPSISSLHCSSRMSLEPSSLSSAAHCSVPESIWPTKERACNWNLNVAQTELL